MISFKEDELKACYDFAKNMKGNHNSAILFNRDDWEIFRDDFRGKLGEIAVRKYIGEKMPHANITADIDFTVSPRGIWDITDIDINGQSLSVKSIKQNSKFLMIECKRFNHDGTYNYKNNNNEKINIAYYVLVRVTIQPDVDAGIFYYKNFEEFKNKAFNGKGKPKVQREIYAEVLGGLSHDEFWRNKHFAKNGIRCSVKNLKAIVDGVSIEKLPDVIVGNEKKNEILQQENYIIDGEHELSKLEHLLNLKTK